MFNCDVIIKKSKNPKLFGIKWSGREIPTTTKRNRIELFDLLDYEEDQLFKQAPLTQLIPGLDNYNLTIEDYMNRNLLKEREKTTIKVYCPHRMAFEIVGCNVESLVKCGDVRVLGFGKEEMTFIDPPSINFTLRGSSKINVLHTRSCKATGVQHDTSIATLEGNFPGLNMKGNPPHTKTIMIGTYSTSTGDTARELMVDQISSSNASM